LMLWGRARRGRLVQEIGKEPYLCTRKASPENGKLQRGKGLPLGANPWWASGERFLEKEPGTVLQAREIPRENLFTHGRFNKGKSNNFQRNIVKGEGSVGIRLSLRKKKCS